MNSIDETFFSRWTTRNLSTTFYTQKKRKNSVKTCMDTTTFAFYVGYAINRYEFDRHPPVENSSTNVIDISIWTNKRNNKKKWKKTVWMKGSVFWLHHDVNLTLCKAHNIHMYSAMRRSSDGYVLDLFGWMATNRFYWTQREIRNFNFRRYMEAEGILYRTMKAMDFGHWI